MSQVTIIHQAILDRTVAVLPVGYKRLSNPYVADDNSDLLLKQGYGVTIGAGQSQKITQQPVLRINRTFGVVLTRAYVARADDAAAKATTEKQLLEDAALIQADLEEGITLNHKVLLTTSVGDGGIEYVATSTNRFLKVALQFRVEYFEGAT